MSISIDINHLVREILTDLTQTTTSGPKTADTVQKTPAPTPVKMETPAEESVFLDQRVISLADVKRVATQAKKVYIPAGSLLTPSAKDEIKKQKIEIAVRLNNSSQDETAALWLALHAPCTLPALQLERLNKRYRIKQNRFEDLAVLLEQAQKELEPQRHLGVALTQHAAKALCWGNRNQAIRAMLAADPVQTAADAAELDANLLVVHPGRVQSAGIPELIAAFVNQKH